MDGENETEGHKEVSLEVMDAVDETIKYLATRLGIVLLESKTGHESVAALPFFVYSEEGEKRANFIMQKDKIIRNAIISVLIGFERLAGQTITLMSYHDGIELIRQNIKIWDEEDE